MKKSTYLVFGVLLLMLVMVLSVNAQGGPPPPPPNPETPIDGGVFILLVGGMIYGAKKLYNKE